jgi:hypothetical protein
LLTSAIRLSGDSGAAFTSALSFTKFTLHLSFTAIRLCSYTFPTGMLENLLAHNACVLLNATDDISATDWIE